MSVRSISPTASLLKNSRLFSLPPPLPKPRSELGYTSNSTSDSATQPFPTQAAIATTESGLARGDWGLKRPLPLKSTTKTSTPCVQFDNIDSIDHITDFKSAAPYSQTLKKWQELDLPLWKYHTGRDAKVTSGFESHDDRTCHVTTRSSKQRWRFEGPWLANLTEEEYLSYLRHKVKNRRLEFREFLKDAIARERQITLKKSLRDRGESEAAVMSADEQAETLNEKELDDAIRSLRQVPDKLDQYVEAFLDLPRNIDGTEDGPPSTHPSAGLSYQRSRAYAANHPLHGPQEFKYIVEARVLRASQSARSSRGSGAILGVGGIAAPGIAHGPFSGKSSSNHDASAGSTIWTQVDSATITPQGRIQVKVAGPEDKALTTRGVSPHSMKQEPPSRTDQTTKPMSEMPPLRGSSVGYGLEEKAIPRIERAKPIANPENSLQQLMSTLKT